jgi:hypothetical protein
MGQKHRGPGPDDARLFGDSALGRLRTAAAEVVWLLDKGYPLAPAVQFVGGHHQLQARQRMALSRSVCSTAQRLARGTRRMKPEELRGERMALDGLNVVIALEVALSGGVLLQGLDGTLRDLAGLRGSYHLVQETEEAVRLIGTTAAALGLRRLDWYLDAPVSNSGRLRGLILQHARQWPFACSAELVPNPDHVLIDDDVVATSDSAILDRCARWVNLGAWIVEENVPRAWRVALTAP